MTRGRMKPGGGNNSGAPPTTGQEVPMSQSNGVSDAPVTFQGRVVVEQSRARQTEPPTKPFREILAGGVSVLMGGAQVATSVLAGPVLAAAVQDARVQATGAIAGAPGRSASGVTSGAMGAL